MPPETSLPLPLLEAWMQTVLVHPGGAEAGLSSPGAEALLPSGRSGEVVKLKGGLSAADRLSIYAGMYPMRMREALASDYPHLLAALGEERFDSLVRDYVEAYPSRSYTLNRLGDRLPEFLTTWGPKPRRAFRSGLARLEHAISQVFDADEAPPLSPVTLERVPPEAWSRARFVPVPAFRIVSAPVSAAAALDGPGDGNTVRAGSHGEILVLFFRRDFAVRRRELPPDAGALLVRLAAGETLGAALAVLEKRFRSRVSPDALSRWFRGWVSDGFFARLEVDPPDA